MKRVLVLTLVVATLAALVGIASAHGPMGWGGGPGWGMRGAGFGPGGGGPGFGCGASGAPAAQITAEKAKELAQGYAKQYLDGYTVERVLPVQRRFATMYQAELKGPAGEQRVLHVNPWGNVVPFGGPIAR